MREGDRDVDLPTEGKIVIRIGLSQDCNYREIAIQNTVLLEGNGCD